MRVNENFVLREVANTWVVLPLGQAVLDFNGMLTLNESGFLLWEELEKGCDREGLIDARTREYAVSREIAGSDVDEFLNKLAKAGCIVE